MKRALAFLVLAACGAALPPVNLHGDWPAKPGDYDAVTESWTRRGMLRGEYQEVLDLAVTIKSPDWRAAHAERQADFRNLDGPARAQLVAQAQADAAGPYELELMVTTWDRRENDLDRGKKSVWHVVLVDDVGQEIEPIEIVRDRRPAFTIRAEFPALGDFAVPYVARFPHDKPVFGPNVKAIRLRMSSERGGVELLWP